MSEVHNYLTVAIISVIYWCYFTHLLYVNFKYAVGLTCRNTINVISLAQ